MHLILSKNVVFNKKKHRDDLKDTSDIVASVYKKRKSFTYFYDVEMMK